MKALAGLLLAAIALLVCCVRVLSPNPGYYGDELPAPVRPLPGQLRLITEVRQLADARQVEAGPASGYPDRGYPAQAPSPNGLPTISDTYNPRDQGTDWPLDAFSARVVGHQSPGSIATPAMHSYDGDGNMEGITAFPPFSHQEDRMNLGAYTGAVGPAGGSTPESHPEVTAP